jgi:predicted TIM-barrel fold metal-dependent hydrolase
VAAVDRLREAIGEITAIDQHAHLLDHPADAPALHDVLSESRDAAQRELVREQPVYRWALRELGALLGVDPSEAALASARQTEDYAARLLAACRFDEMFVDDGFRSAGTMSLDEHTASVPCTVRRVVRIETEVESAGAAWPPFQECRSAFQEAISAARAAGAVGLKTIAAYRCGLDLPAPSLDAAVEAYEAWRRSGTSRLTDRALVSFFVADALEAAGPDVPLQVHTSLGDADQLLLGADPALLQPHLDHGFLAGAPVVLLHCYPFIRHAGYLASIFRNVHVDLSLALTLVPQRGSTLVAEALELTPPSKLLFATDASRIPEMYVLGSRWWRESLSRALGDLVDEDLIDDALALDWSEQILAGNARRLYRLEELRDKAGGRAPLRSGGGELGR